MLELAVAVRDWASLVLVAVVLWVLWVEYWRMRRGAGW